MRPNILNIGLFYFWFLGFKFQNLEDKGGATTTPHILSRVPNFIKRAFCT